MIVKIIFKFAALQSKKGIELLEKFNLPKDDFDSFILISDNKVFRKSNAAFEIAKQIRRLAKDLFYPFRILPTLLTDFVYDIIAKNRYKLFGKKEACRIPTPEEKNQISLT